MKAQYQNKSKCTRTRAAGKRLLWDCERAHRNTETQNVCETRRANEHHLACECDISFQISYKPYTWLVTVLSFSYTREMQKELFATKMHHDSHVILQCKTFDIYLVAAFWRESACLHANSSVLWCLPGSSSPSRTPPQRCSAAREGESTGRCCWW